MHVTITIFVVKQTKKIQLELKIIMYNSYFAVWFSVWFSNSTSVSKIQLTRVTANFLTFQDINIQ